MQEAAEVINEAVESGKPICVYGDYDCDGVTATVMLYSYLECLGADVRYGGGKPGEQIALWGRYLDLEHPTQKVPMHFDCPPPNAFPFQLFTDICREQA